MTNDLVSIIMPCYNNELYIGESIESVINQTYKNWELLIVDDLSTDKSIEVAKKYKNNDSRIKIYTLREKGGASEARNLAIRNARGRYIAFLDSDDLWEKEKLDIQVKFMKQKKCFFSYTNYKIQDKNNHLRHVNAPNRITYKDMLKRNWIGCLTVMYDSKAIGLVQIPRIDKRNDYALWLHILKKIDFGLLCDAELAIYRMNNGLSSTKKYKLLKYHFQLFRNNLGLSLIKSIYYMNLNIFNYILYKKRRRQTNDKYIGNSC